MTVNEYIEAVKQAHIDCGLPIPDAHAMAMVVDAWHKATRAERERCAKIASHLSEHHDFYDGPFDVAKKIAAAIREAPAT